MNTERMTFDERLKANPHLRIALDSWGTQARIEVPADLYPEFIDALEAVCAAVAADERARTVKREHKKLVKAVKANLAQTEQLRRNASRYLWLREQMEVTRNLACPSCISLPHIRTEVDCEDNGAFIDAALDREITEALGWLRSEVACTAMIAAAPSPQERGDG